MAIQQRLKKDTPEQAEAKARWKEVQRGMFNADESLFNYHQRFWDEHWPRLLVKVQEENPALAKRLAGDCSWDRKMIGLLYFLDGSPVDKRQWPDDKDITRMNKQRELGLRKEENNPPAPKKKLLKLTKRTPGT